MAAVLHGSRTFFSHTFFNPRAAWQHGCMAAVLHGMEDPPNLPRVFFVFFEGYGQCPFPLVAYQGLLCLIRLIGADVRTPPF